MALDTTRTAPSTPDVPTEPTPAGIPARITDWCVRRRRRVLASAAILLVLTAMVVVGAADRWSNGGFTATGTPAAEAERAAARFGAGTADLVFYARADTPVDSPDIAEEGRRLTATIAARPGVTSAVSYWSTGSPALLSKDGRGALIRVDLTGTERDTVATARALVPATRTASDTLRVTATGRAWLNAQSTDESESDLKHSEILAAPLTLLILLLAFGSLTAAAIPIALGVFSAATSLAALVALTHAMPITVFATNVCAALGFALSVDYGLFIVTRYREELGHGTDPHEAIVRSMVTAGRAVLFSAATVALCLSALFVFPLELVRSLACASIIVVLISALGSALVLPAVLAVVGRRLDSLDPFRRLRRSRGAKGTVSPFWRRVATLATGRPILCGGVAVIVLLTLAFPFTHARFSTVDEKILPAHAEPHRTAQLLREDFAAPPERIIPVVLPRTDPVADAPALDAYARRLSALPHVALVTAETGDYHHGMPVLDTTRTPETRPPGSAGGTLLRVVGTADSQSPASVALVRDIRALPGPQPHLVAGTATELLDTKKALRDAMPYGLGIMLAGTLVMLFLFTRSILVPLKAVLMGLLSITAALGVIVYVFQDGHLRSLVGDFTTGGTLESTMPLLTLAVAFGISVDYEVFLLARIKEEYVRTGDNTRSIIFGIEHTGRLFTAAALIVATTMAALALSHVTLLKVVGVGLAVAVLIDATIVRGVLVPALMRLTGRANWWSPSLRRRRKPQERTDTSSTVDSADAPMVADEDAGAPDAQAAKT